MPRLRRSLAWVASAIVLALLVAQAFPVPRQNPAVTGDVGAPPPVSAILRRACYDCHSNETVWPWYSGVAPLSWLIAWDVVEGRRELNFSTWPAYDPAARRKKLNESMEELREGEMPPWPYVMMHPEACLTASERDVLLAWMSAEIERSSGR